MARDPSGRSHSSRGGPARPPRAATPPLPPAVACPFCDGNETELFTPFGTVASVAQYYCRTCRTVFEYLKWEPPQG